MTKIAVIGGGMIGTALIGGLIEGGADPQSIYVVETNADRLSQLVETYQVVDADSLDNAVDTADVIFLCVKPEQVVKVIEPVAETIDDSEGDSVVVSLAAGVTVETLENVLNVGTSVIRMMPNTPMLVGKGTVALAPGRFATEEHVELVESLVQTVATVERVTDAQMSAVTAISGSGPAYFFQFVEAMIDAGVALGLTRQQASRLARSTAAGAAEMMMQPDVDPVALRAQVTSPGGTTAAATQTFEEEGLRRAVHRALTACYQRSVELGRKEKP